MEQLCYRDMTTSGKRTDNSQRSKTSVLKEQ